MDSVETNKHFCSLAGSHAILVFPYQTSWQFSDGDLLTGVSNDVGAEKIATLDQYLAIGEMLVKCEQQLRPSTVQL